MTVRDRFVTLGAFETKTGNSLCDLGEKVVGGGVSVDTSGSTNVVSSYPNTALVNSFGVNVQGWSARGGLNFGWAAGGFTVFAICAAF